MTAYCQLRRLLALLVSGRCRCAAAAEAARPGTASLPQDRPDRSRGASGSTPPALSRSPCCYLAVTLPVGVGARFGLADESNAGVGARSALTEVLRELGTLSQLHRRAPSTTPSALGRGELQEVKEVLGRDFDSYLALRLDCPGYCLMTSSDSSPKTACPAHQGSAMYDAPSA